MNDKKMMGDTSLNPTADSPEPVEGHGEGQRNLAAHSLIGAGLAGKWGVGAAFLLGAISALGMAPLGWWPLTLITLAAFIWLLAETKRGGFALGWWFGFGHFLIGLNWLPTSFGYQAKMPAFLGWVALALLAAYMALYPALAAWAAKRIAGKSVSDQPLPLILALAGSWALAEWLRATLFTGFAWNPLAEVALPMGLGGAAARFGTYGLSAIMLLIAGAIVLLAWRHWLSAALLLAYPLLIWGVAFISIPYHDGPGVHVTLVQPNIGQGEKWEGAAVDTNFAKLANLSIRKPIISNSRIDEEPNPPRLLLWTEAAFPDYLEDGYPNDYYRIPPVMQRQRIAALLGPQDVILTGGLKLEFDKMGAVTGARNSIFAMNAKGEILGRYDKSHLVPFGEYLPLRPILTPLGVSRLVPGSVDFIPGPGAQTMEIPGFGKAGLLVCYEMIFSGHVVNRTNRPDFIFSPSNDAWFGGWGAPQHHAQSRLRAIEEGLPIIRVTPTGISSIIDAEGNTVASIPQGVAGRVDDVIPPALEPTLFSQYGNAIPLLFSLILVIVSFVLARRTTSR